MLRGNFSGSGSELSLFGMEDVLYNMYFYVGSIWILCHVLVVLSGGVALSGDNKYRNGTNQILLIPFTSLNIQLTLFNSYTENTTKRHSSLCSHCTKFFWQYTGHPRHARHANQTHATCAKARVPPTINPKSRSHNIVAAASEGSLLLRARSPPPCLCVIPLGIPGRVFLPESLYPRETMEYRPV
ncbi:hypothetical protein CDAR_105221 [Caerostris darwini]|uniref:Uncharacterized protein n=1 Tax=Caerostris darwini TaxID=1538125 RepID=A0AAV4V739_9ARAC|nr:hypothetical protein CDAR_105221 [Caerostris darwini]